MSASEKATQTSIPWFVYILTCSDGLLYTGSTNNVEKRVATHQSGKGAKYTRSHLPVTLTYVEKCQDRSEAGQREAIIKKLSRKEKVKLILNDEVQQRQVQQLPPHLQQTVTPVTKHRL